MFKSTVEKINILTDYLPEQLLEDEIANEIKQIISENTDVPIGKLTGIVMKSLKGKADNKVKKYLMKLINNTLNYTLN